MKKTSSRKSRDTVPLNKCLNKCILEWGSAEFSRVGNIWNLFYLTEFILDMILYLCFHDAGPCSHYHDFHLFHCTLIPPVDLPPPPSFFSLKFSFDFLILYLFLLLLSWLVFFCLSHEFSPMSDFLLLYPWLFLLCHLFLLFSRVLLMTNFLPWLFIFSLYTSSLLLTFIRMLLVLLPVPWVFS